MYLKMLTPLFGRLMGEDETEIVKDPFKLQSCP
jgi:hypothetical protein